MGEHIPGIIERFVKMNSFEKKVKLYLEGLGFEVLRNGYPDFMIRRLGQYKGQHKGLACVEVKNRNDKLRPEQVRMIDAFKELGLPTYILRPQDFEKGDNSHQQTPTGKEKAIGRCKRVISAKDYKRLSSDIAHLKQGVESRSEWWLNTVLRKIDDELQHYLKILDKISEVEEFIKSHGVVIEVDEPKDLLNHPE